jgi:hypothetical protein
VSRFRTGELLVPVDRVFGTTVWSADLNDVADVLENGEIATVVRSEDGYGWTWVLTPRGVSGVVHKNNLRKLVQS